MTRAVPAGRCPPGRTAWSPRIAVARRPRRTPGCRSAAGPGSSASPSPEDPHAVRGHVHAVVTESCLEPQLIHDGALPSSSPNGHCRHGQRDPGGLLRPHSGVALHQDRLSCYLLAREPAMLTAGRSVPVSRAARASRSAPSDDLSLASAFSIGSAASVGSILSALSRWSILAWGARGHAPLPRRQR